MRLRPALLASLLAVSATCRAETPLPDLVLESVDGSLIPGTLPRDASVTIVTAAGERKVGAPELLGLHVSAMREADAAKLEASAKAIAERWRAESVEERTAATEAARALPGASAVYFADCLADKDPEVVVRAREVIAFFRARKQLADPRDLIVLDGSVVQGWLKAETLTLETAHGPVTLPLTAVRRLRMALPRPIPGGAEVWSPPEAVAAPREPGKGRLYAVVQLGGGWRLVGEMEPDALTVVIGKSTRVAGEDLARLVHQGKNGGFRVSLKGFAAAPARIDAREFVAVACGRTWTLPVDRIEVITWGAPQEADALARLVDQHVRAKAAGMELPTQRFWVHIRDQQANPWDSPSKLGMTWKLMEVNGDACLVGADESTNAYNGDTDVAEELPILCIRKTGAAPPDGLDVSNAYKGWGGGEVRLTRPVRGTDMVSLEATQRIIEEELGEGWRMAQHHDSSTIGWHWWAYWQDPR